MFIDLIEGIEDKMNKDKYFPPKHLEGQFHCPHCRVYSKQYWSWIKADPNIDYCHNDIPNSLSNFNERLPNFWKISKCEHCHKNIFWFNNSIIYPNQSFIEVPNEDLSNEIKNDYIEASNIVNNSPRAAAALLRLAIQKLCIQLGEKGKDLDTDIGNLVKKGLNIQVQKSLDTLRVVGNNAVHPGQIDINDNKELVVKMFSLINFISEKMITEPKEIDQLYSDILPENAKEHVKERDNK